MTSPLDALLDGRPVRARRDSNGSGYGKWVELPVDGEFFIEVARLKSIIREMRGLHYTMVIEPNRVVIAWRHGRGQLRLHGMAAAGLLVLNPNGDRGSIKLSQLKRGRRLVESPVW